MNDILQKCYRQFTENPSISTDSRQISPGSIFFALRGENFDGNQYAAQAIQKGASLAVVDDPAIAASAQIIKVKNVLETLQELAMMHRRQLKIPVLGITGSNGKTTTKELIKNVLSQRFKTFATVGNLNNHIGVPLSILSIDKSYEIAVIEMGANHQGEIANLCRIAQPDYGIITNIGKAHLEGFGGYPGVIKAKTELYDFISKHLGKLFVNANDALLIEKAEGIEQINYGNSKDALVSGSIAKPFPFLNIDLGIDNKNHPIESQLVGSYNLDNMLAAACVGKYFGVNVKGIIAGLSSYKPGNSRSEWRETPHNQIVLDAYNANPGSMMAALENFVAAPYPRKAVILGDMLELGKASREEHQQIITYLLNQKLNKIILVGKNFKALAEDQNGIAAYADVEEAKSAIAKTNMQGYTFLIKGSRGIRLEKLLEVL